MFSRPMLRALQTYFLHARSGGVKIVRLVLGPNKSRTDCILSMDAASKAADRGRPWFLAIVLSIVSQISLSPFAGSSTASDAWRIRQLDQFRPTVEFHLGLRFPTIGNLGGLC
jgi:hypothetical protein